MYHVMFGYYIHEDLLSRKEEGKEETALLMNTKTVLTAAAIAVASTLVSLYVLPSLRDVNHEANINPRLEVLPIKDATGPESFAFDANGGGPYTGVSDGRILKWEAQQHRWIQYAASASLMSNECKVSQNPELEHVCGRPLGLRFNEKTGDLYIADAYLGLLMVSPNITSTTSIATHADGVPFYFTNSLDIDQDTGVIYFTDSSTRFRRREFISAIIRGDNTGRLMKYNPRNKQLQVLLDGLSFPNGILLINDGTSLLIAETTKCRILRYSLTDPLTATFDVVAELPGFPDNIKKSPRGGFWVAIHSRRGRLVQWLLSIPWVWEVFLRIPFDVQRLASLMSRWRGKALAIRLSAEGEVLQVLEGFGGSLIKSISEVEERNGSLWIGSVVLPFVGKYNISY